MSHNPFQGKATRHSNPLQGKAGEESHGSKHLCFSFRHFQSNQGQKPDEWESEKLLSKAFDKIKEFSSKTLKECINIPQYFAIYEKWPSNSKFTQPHRSIIPEDAKWVRIRIQQKVRLIGHLVGNVFMVVFLDKDHEFYPTEAD